MEVNIDWLFDDSLPCVDPPSSHHKLKNMVKCEPCSEGQLYGGALVKAEVFVKEEVLAKEEREDNAVADIDEKVGWPFDETLASENWPGCDPTGGSEENEGADFEDQVPDGADMEAVSAVKEEVLVKEEREDQSGVMQSLSFPAGCGACEYKCGRAEESIKYRGLKYVLLKRLPETGLGLAQGEHGMECKAERSQALQPEVNLDKGGTVKSHGGRQEEEGTVVKRGCVGQGLLPAEDYQVEVNGGCHEGRGVTRLGEGERQEQEEGMNLQARAESSVTQDNPSGFVAGMSASSWAPVASSSSSPEVSEPGPGVSGQETGELSPLEKRQHGPPRQKQQRRKKGPVQSPGKVVPEEAGDVCRPHGNVQTLPEGVKRQRQACPHCDFRCAMRDTLTRHVERCHGGLERLPPSCSSVSSRKRKNMREGLEVTPGGSKELQCLHCPHNALSQADLKAHRERVHKGLKKFKCSQCQFTNVCKFRLQRHIKIVHEHLKEHKCEHCQFRTALKHNLQTHTETVHEGLKRYPCPHCVYRAGQRGTLQKHILTVHEGFRKYECPQCPYRAGQKAHLQTHVKTVHEGVRQHKCPHCPYNAGLKAHLLKHIKTVHDSSRRYECSQCPYRASLKASLQRHIETVHEGLRKHKCPHCLYRAGQRGTLLAHIVALHGGSSEHKCPHCSYTASQKNHLQSHIETVHEGVRKFKCPHCPYRAGIRGRLETHIKIVHEGMRKHKCPHCPYRAGETGNLKAHVEAVHQGVRKHQCPHCSYRAGQNSTLKRHVHRKHEGKV